MNKKQIEQKEALTLLKDRLKENDTIHAIIRTVSQSGMSRNISFKAIDNNELIDLSWHIAKAMDYSFNDKKHALRVSGCGMDMAFHVTDNLSRMLGYKLKSRVI